MDTTEQYFDKLIAKHFAITVCSILEVDNRLLYYLGHIRSPRATLIKFKNLILPQCSNPSTYLLFTLQLQI
jgi:hypothetical protein